MSKIRKSAEEWLNNAIKGKLRQLIFILVFSMFGNTVFAVGLPLAALSIVKSVKSEDPAISDSAASSVDEFERLFLDVRSKHTQKRDRTARQIDLALRRAFSDYYPRLKLVLPNQAPSAVDPKGTIFLSVEYEQSTSGISLRYKLTEGFKKGLLLVSGKEKYRNLDSSENNLIAVLALEVNGLTVEQQKAFTEAFRSRLSRNISLKIVNSEKLVQVGFGKFQKSNGCSENECASLIGLQLGVNRVVAGSIIRFGPEYYILTAKIIDVKGAQVISQESIKLKKKASAIPHHINLLVDKLVRNNRNLLAAESQAAWVAPSGESEPRWNPPLMTIEDSVPGPESYRDHSALLHGIVIGVSLLSAKQAASYSSKRNDLIEQNSALEAEYATALTSRKAELAQEYQQNQSDMEKYRRNYLVLDMITVGGLAWEFFLLNSGGYFAQVRQPGLKLDWNTLNGPSLAWKMAW